MADFYASYPFEGGGGGGILSINGDTTPAQLIVGGTDISVNTVGGTTTIASTQAAGNLTDVGTDGIIITGGTGAVIGSGTSLAQTKSDATHNGYLSSGDWTTFNAKQAAGNYITALTGDGSAAGPGSVGLTLATVNSNVGSFGTASSVSSLTVNGKGLVTAASNTAIQIAESQVTNLVADLAGKQATGNYITALTGDVTAAGPGSVAATIASGAVTNAKIAASAGISVNKLAALTISSNVRSDGSGFLTTGAIGLGTSDVSGTLPIGSGGTGQTTKAPAFDALSPMSVSGDIIYGGASGTGTRLGIGANGTFLSVAAGIPSYVVNPVGAWTSYTPTGTWTNGTFSGFYRLIRDTLEINAQFACTNTQSGTFTLSLPGGFTINASLIPAGIVSGNLAMPFSGGSFYDASGSAYPLGILYNGTTSVRASTLPSATNGAVYQAIDGGSPVAKASGDILTVFFSVPVT